MMLEDDASQHEKIEQHLRRSFDAGDRNFDARHLYAQFLFMVGRIAEATNLFAEVHEQAPDDFRLQTPRTHSLISKQLSRYTGRVNRKLESYLFITSPSYPTDIYANEAGTKDQDWDELTDGSEVNF